MEWGVCCTAKAPLAQLLAFVAWHRHVGAKHIWVHLDDADEISGHVLNQIDGVTAVLCDDAYWLRTLGMRPRRQEPRQSYNMQRIYGEAALPVIAHVDVDEYLYSDKVIADVLDDIGDAPFIRVAPAEALHDPSLKDDIFTARQFRLPFPNGMNAEDRMAVLGDYTALLKKNMLSHKVGKSFFRTGVDGLVPKIHAGSFGKDEPPLHVGVHPDVVVLHFHAQDRTAWRAALPHRAVNGAYRFNAPLADFLAEATDADIDAFYDNTQVATPELIAALAQYNLLVHAKLDLRAKVEDLPF